MYGSLGVNSNVFPTVRFLLCVLGTPLENPLVSQGIIPSSGICTQNPLFRVHFPEEVFPWPLGTWIVGLIDLSTTCKNIPEDGLCEEIRPTKAGGKATPSTKELRIKTFPDVANSNRRGVLPDNRLKRRRTSNLCCGPSFFWGEQTTRTTTASGRPVLADNP
jgi:hypothetical protein